MKIKLRQVLVVLLLLIPVKTKNAAADTTWYFLQKFSENSPEMRQVRQVKGIRLSCYHLVKEQTDSTPLQAKWFDYRGKDLNRYFGKHCALSWDLISKYKIKGGDTVYVSTKKGSEVFPLIVTDVTNSRWKNTIDVVEKKETNYLYDDAVVFINKRN